MDRHVTATPEGVCAREICFDIVDGIIHNVKFTGGLVWRESPQSRRIGTTPSDRRRSGSSGKRDRS